jgi:hypothetical protein
MSSLFYIGRMGTLPRLSFGFQFLILASLLVFGADALGQANPPAPVEGSNTVGDHQTIDGPLPEISALLREVGSHQKAAEDIRKDYLFHSISRVQEQNGKGDVKKTSTIESDHFWIGGVPVQKATKKDGRELTAEEQKKQSERIDKDVAKAREKKGKADSEGKETTPRGDDWITASRFLELGSFTNARRIELDQRSTIVVDFTGNPKAKTRNRGEDVVRDIEGTVWIDEEDRAIRRIEGHFINPFKIGGGLIVNVHKDTSFLFDQRKINGEVWLPALFKGKGGVRALLLISFNGNAEVQMSDYRKFKATSTILPGVSTVEDGTAGASETNGVNGSFATPPQ